MSDTYMAEIDEQMFGDRVSGRTGNYTLPACPYGLHWHSDFRKGRCRPTDATDREYHRTYMQHLMSADAVAGTLRFQMAHGFIKRDDGMVLR